jgi:hypothetical protein
MHMSGNAKNQLLELLKKLGCSDNCSNFQSIRESSSGWYLSTVVVTFPDGRQIQGAAKRKQKSDAEIAASQVALDQLHENYRDLIVNWDSIYLEAQAGDALIKLGVYLSLDLSNASEASKRLQKLESDHHLAKVFDCWKAQKNSDLAIWGNVLSEKRKATLVEALLWRRFKIETVTDNILVPLQSLLKTLTVD